MSNDVCNDHTNRSNASECRGDHQTDRTAVDRDRNRFRHIGRFQAPSAHRRTGRINDQIDADDRRRAPVPGAEGRIAKILGLFPIGNRMVGDLIVGNVIFLPLRRVNPIVGTARNDQTGQANPAEYQRQTHAKPPVRMRNFHDVMPSVRANHFFSLFISNITWQRECKGKFFFETNRVHLAEKNLDDLVEFG